MTRFLDTGLNDMTRNRLGSLEQQLRTSGSVNLHPFEDGNGRIARAIADLVLARSEEDRAALLQHVSPDPKRARCLL